MQLRGIKNTTRKPERCARSKWCSPCTPPRIARPRSACAGKTLPASGSVCDPGAPPSPSDRHNVRIAQHGRAGSTSCVDITRQCITHAIYATRGCFSPSGRAASRSGGTWPAPGTQKRSRSQNSSCRSQCKSSCQTGGSPDRMSGGRRRRMHRSNGNQLHRCDRSARLRTARVRRQYGSVPPQGCPPPQSPEKRCICVAVSV